MIWNKFTFKWYLQLLENDALLLAVFSSFKIASLSATLAVILGTLAALIVVRFGRFRGRVAFGGLITAPLVMPEVITGLAMLMMFVALERIIGWPTERGIITVTIAHTTLAMAYVYLVVQSRLVDFDRSLEEAALDLGAKPIEVFLKITLPLIAPALLAGWLLAFALSLDDVVLASFLSGPGATTLPMLIFSSVRFGIDPQINALATIIVCIVMVAVGISGFIVHKKLRNSVT
jgi:putrescine transport system permease protein